jgi:hypothetical protein
MILEVDLTLEEHRSVETQRHRYQPPAQRRALAHPFGKPLPHRRGGDRLLVARPIDRQPAIVRAVISALGRQELRVEARKAMHQNTLRMILIAFSV